MEKDPVTSEEKEESSENGRGTMSEWFVENLRMVVSVVIVVVIAIGIYSYSKRAQIPDMQKKAASNMEESSEGKISVIGGDEDQNSTEEEQMGESEEQEQPTSTPAEEAPVAQPQTSQETGASFVETAARGESSTVLARRALANYLEKNPDSGLTAEHKIYIEDFLRRQVKSGGLNIGDKLEFSKSNIATAIEKSKGLNEAQLKNLQKYAQRVPGLK